MIGYKTAAGRKDFLTDALGPVTAEVDQTGNTKTFDGRYKPYGGDLSSTGTRGSYGWIGKWGYRETGLSGSSHYVRARHYSNKSGNWTTRDPLFPRQRPMAYVTGKVLRATDPSGLIVTGSNCRGPSFDCCNTFNDSKDNIVGKYAACMLSKGFNIDQAMRIWDYWVFACGTNLSGPQICMHCTDKPPSLDEPISFCKHSPCGPDVAGLNLCPDNSQPPWGLPPPWGIPIPGPKCIIWKGQSNCAYFCAKEKERGCSCSIFLCSKELVPPGSGQGSKEGFCKLMFHEIVHCTGVGHGTPLPIRFGDIVYSAAGCLSLALYYGDIL
jgi:RHS repeat-associated protein